MILLQRRASSCRPAQSQNARHSQLRTPHRAHDRTFLWWPGRPARRFRQKWFRRFRQRWSRWWTVWAPWHRRKGRWRRRRHQRLHRRKGWWWHQRSDEAVGSPRPTGPDPVPPIVFHSTSKGASSRVLTRSIINEQSVSVDQTHQMVTIAHCHSAIYGQIRIAPGRG